MDYKKLPQALKEMDVFCLWKYQKDKSGNMKNQHKGLILHAD